MKALLFPVFFLSLFLSGTAPSPTPQAAGRGVALPLELRQLMNHMDMVQLPDGLGGTVLTIRFHGANVQIVNGTGITDGVVDGAGNLIVGYNELRGAGDDRSGSHNLVVGKEHNFSSFGGLLAGQRNTVSGGWSSVSGGRLNAASGLLSSVSGGAFNEASGNYSSVSGGIGNTASANYASVSGGEFNTASGNYASVSGGRFNAASGNYASVSGGRFNIASGTYSSVSGGNSRSALNTDDWVAGALFENN
jgi:hypothetical protein